MTHGNRQQLSKWCLFCPAKADTCEHVWSGWMGKMLPPTTYTFRRRHITGIQTWKTAKPSLKVRLVCSGCNNGWMSNLEGRMKAACADILLEPTARELSFEDCKVMSAFALKTAVLANHMKVARKPFYTLLERRRFASEQLIPAGVHVWVAKRGSRHVTGMFRSIYGLGRARAPYGFELHTCTFSLGFLVLQVATTRWTTRKVMRQLGPPPITQSRAWDRYSIPIWPNDGFGVGWPPQSSIDDDVAERYWNRFARLDIPNWMALDY